MKIIIFQVSSKNQQKRYFLFDELFGKHFLFLSDEEFKYQDKKLSFVLLSSFIQGTYK